MGAQLAAAYGGGLPAAAGYPATHPGIPAPTVAGPTNTTQFQKQAYGSRCASVQPLPNFMTPNMPVLKGVDPCFLFTTLDSAQWTP